MMKKIIFMLVLGFISSNVIAGGLLSKDQLVEIIEGTIGDTICTDNHNTCLSVKKSTCIAEAKQIIRDKCSSDVPDEIEDLDEVRSYSKSVAKCTTKKYIAKHNVALKKNKNTPACQALLN